MSQMLKAFWLKSRKNKMNLDLNTFGKTPAAHYLVRRLNELQNKSLARACTVRVNAFNTSCAGIEYSVGFGAMSSKVGANLLRLLREEATAIELVGTPAQEVNFVANLLRNVIIGHIKSVMRKITVVRKIENGTKDINTLMKKASVERTTADSTIYSILGYDCAVVVGPKELDGEQNLFTLYANVPTIGSVEDPTTPEVLYERSLNRCKRQQKEWALAQK
jgi:hypothetical protein